MSENDLSRKIKQLRANQKITLEEIARHVGVGKSTVRKWEVGQIENMRRDKIGKLAEALHTSPQYLMGWTDDPSPEDTSATTINLLPDESELLGLYRGVTVQGQTLILGNARMIAGMDEYKR